MTRGRKTLPARRVPLEANDTRDRGPLPEQAKLLVEKLRFWVWLAFDSRCLRATGYGFAAGELDAVGTMAGDSRKVGAD